MVRFATYRRNHLEPSATEPDLDRRLRDAVAKAGGALTATFADDHRLSGRGKYAGWRALLGRLDDVDTLLVVSAGHLPGRITPDLLRVLEILRSHNVSLRLLREEIDTGHCSALALLDLLAAYRAAKRSQAIRTGQARARQAGKMIGRPRIDRRVAAQVEAALRAGDGIRPTARKYGVAPSSVVNLGRAASPNSANMSNAPD
jgi:DNA invertase Pin-like site-specific DNA recombinase